MAFNVTSIGTNGVLRMLRVELSDGIKGCLLNFRQRSFSLSTAKIRSCYLKVVKMQPEREESFTEFLMQLLWSFGLVFELYMERTSLVFTEIGAKINSNIYPNDILKKELLPWAQNRLHIQDGPSDRMAHTLTSWKWLRSGAWIIFPSSVLPLNDHQTRQVWMLWTTAFSLFWEKKLSLNGTLWLKVWNPQWKEHGRKKHKHPCVPPLSHTLRVWGLSFVSGEAILNDIHFCFWQIVGKLMTKFRCFFFSSTGVFRVSLSAHIYRTLCRNLQDTLLS